MKKRLTSLPLAAALCVTQESGDHQKELAFGLHGISALSRSDSASREAVSGSAFDVNYGRLSLDTTTVALLGDINLIASPLRDGCARDNRAARSRRRVDIRTIPD